MRQPFLDEPDEAARLAALERYAIIDTPAEDDFTQLVELAALTFRVPWAAITFVDGFRAWRKAAYPADQRREAPRAVSFCGQTIKNSEVMVVNDAAADPCFADFPNVAGGAHVRFYAGAPLVTSDGHRLGTLCILDNVPRELDATQIELMRGFAREAMQKIEVRLKLARTNDLSRQLATVIKAFPIGVVTADIGGRITSCSQIAERITGWSEEELIGKEFPFTPDGQEAEFAGLVKALKRGETVVFERSKLKRKDGSLVDVRVSSAPLYAADGTVAGFVSVGEDINAVEIEAQRKRVLEASVLSAFSRAVMVTTAEPAGDAKIVYVNPTFTQLYGYEANEVLGRGERILLGDGADASVTAKIREARRSQTALNIETTHRRKNGEVFWCALGMTPVVDPAGRCEQWIIFAHDVTDRRRAEHLQRDRMEIVEMMAANEPLEQILAALAAAGERARPDAQVRISIRGRDLHAVEVPHEPDVDHESPPTVTWSSAILAGDHIGGSFVFQAPSGAQPTAEDRRLCDELADIAGIAIERVRDRERLEFLALHDGLTGLPNRTSFEDALRLALAESSSAADKIAIGMIDLDRFKVINDNLGHSMGDRLLAAIAQRLRAEIGPGESLARYGGDEFAVMLTGITSREEATRRAKEIVATLDVPFDISGLKLSVSASVGVCMYPDDAAKQDEMLAHCDAAMYDQKVGKRRSESPKTLRAVR